MSLFEVPGWTVPTEPIASTSSNSRKRKRHAPDADADAKVQSAAVNVEKLIAKLGAGDGKGEKVGGQRDDRKGKGKANGKGKGKARDFGVEGDEAGEGERKAKVAKKGKKADVPAAQNKQHAETQKKDTTGPSSPSKKNKKNKKGAQKQEDNHSTHPAPSPASKSPAKAEKHADPAKGLTALQANMKQSLDGARFRWINETLYKSNSEDAVQMMRENPSVFSEYHTGFRHQVQSWPSNPVAHYISTLSKYPAGTVIADLGCGDAALARALVPKGFTVLSFDLVSDGAFVVQADTCSKIPLPGSEKEDQEEEEEEEEGAQVVHVVVCALSLMSTNWVGCVREAWRVLKKGGELKIAEVASRFSEVEAFVSLVSSVGFRLRSKDDSNTHFTLFEFTKVNRKPKSDKEWAKLMERGSVLKPCEYKRR